MRKGSNVCVMFENPMENLLLLLFCILSQRTFILTSKFLSQGLVLCCTPSIIGFTIWWIIPIPGNTPYWLPWFTPGRPKSCRCLCTHSSLYYEAYSFCRINNWVTLFSSFNINILVDIFTVDFHMFFPDATLNYQQSWCPFVLLWNVSKDGTI